MLLDFLAYAILASALTLFIFLAVPSLCRLNKSHEPYWTRFFDGCLTLLLVMITLIKFLAIISAAVTIVWALNHIFG